MDLLIIFCLGLAAFLWLAKFAWLLLRFVLAGPVYYLTECRYHGKPPERDRPEGSKGRRV